VPVAAALRLPGKGGVAADDELLTDSGSLAPSASAA